MDIFISNFSEQSTIFIVQYFKIKNKSLALEDRHVRSKCCPIFKEKYKNNSRKGGIVSLPEMSFKRLVRSLKGDLLFGSVDSYNFREVFKNFVVDIKAQ